MERKLYEYDYEKPDINDFYIIHYGVKGMKWGVRKSEEKAGIARRQADRINKVYNKSNSRNADLVRHRKKLAKITKSKYHKQTANLADKWRSASTNTVGRVADLLERRAQYKEAIAERKQQKLDYSIQRGKELYEEGINPVSNKDLAKKYVKRGVLTGGARGLARVDGKVRKSKLSSFLGGKKGKVLARGYNVAKTIQGKIDNRDLQNYQEFLEERKREK